MCIRLISLAASFSFFGLILVLRSTACAVLFGWTAAGSGVNIEVAGAGVCMRGLIPAAGAGASCQLAALEVNPCTQSLHLQGLQPPAAKHAG